MKEIKLDLEHRLNKLNAEMHMLSRVKFYCINALLIGMSIMIMDLIKPYENSEGLGLYPSLGLAAMITGGIGVIITKWHISKVRGYIGKVLYWMRDVDKKAQGT